MKPLTASFLLGKTCIRRYLHVGRIIILYKQNEKKLPLAHDKLFLINDIFSWASLLRNLQKQDKIIYWKKQSLTWLYIWFSSSVNFVTLLVNERFWYNNYEKIDLNIFYCISKDTKGLDTSSGNLTMSLPLNQK